MKRLGKLTGRIYEENEIHDMEECGICITDEQANDEYWIKQLRVKSLADCDNCRGCPLYFKRNKTHILYENKIR